MSESNHAIMAIGNNGAIVRSFDDLARLSAMISRSGLAPKDMATPEKIGVAIMWGMEVGLSPVQAIQSIAVINNRPCMWGDALPALVNSSPVCEYVKEAIEGEGDAMAAICVSKRRSSPAEKRTIFSVADAKKAGLWGKAGPWQNYPKRMLQLRARAFNFRDNFADVLRGIGVAEEQMDIPVAEATVFGSIPALPSPEATPKTSELDEFAPAASEPPVQQQTEHSDVSPDFVIAKSIGYAVFHEAFENHVAGLPNRDEFAKTLGAVCLAFPVKLDADKGVAARREVLAALMAGKLGHDGTIQK